MKKKLFTLIIIFFISHLYSNEKSKWIKSGTTWDFTDSKIVTRSPNVSPWGYYELSNLNSLISIEQFQSITDIEITASAFDKEKTPAEIMLSFAVSSEEPPWKYHLYAFKIAGGFWGMNKVTFIYSDKLDKSMPVNTKNNTFIKELASAEYKIKYDKMNNYRIQFEGSEVILYINDEKALSAPFPEKSHDGHIAISAKNVRIAIDKVVVKQNKIIIFEDDFSKNSLQIKYLKATREQNPETETDKKP